ncbi:MAG: RDD family protein [Oscillospiraceae bacterium]
MPDKEVTRAGFGPRAAAYVIDRAILFVALLLVRVPVWLVSLAGGDALTAKSFLFCYSFLDVLCWLLASAYLVLMTYYTGSTLGKKLMRLRVEKENGAALGFVDALYRETVGRFLSGIACIGYLMALADRKKRAFHDYLCDTRVVYDDVVFRVREEKAPAPDRTPSADISAPAPVCLGYSVPGETAARPVATDVETEE